MPRKKTPLIKLKDEQETCKNYFAIYNFYKIYGKLEPNNSIKMGQGYKEELKEKEIQMSLKHVSRYSTHKRNANKDNTIFYLSDWQRANVSYHSISMGVRKLVCYWWECELGQFLLITTWQCLHRLLKQTPFSSATTPLRM